MKHGTKRFISLAIALCFVCGLSACGKGEEQAHKHVFEGDFTVTVAPTCTEDGSEERYCACGEKETRQIKALGHDEQYQTDTKMQTCTEGGWNLYFICRRCNYSSKKELGPLGHSAKKVNKMEATCTARGWETYENCKRCDYTTRSTSTSALGHEFENGVCTRCKTNVTDDLSFAKTENGGYAVDRYSGQSTNVIIPDVYQGSSVTAVLESAFAVQGAEPFIVCADIPGSVRVIGKAAFSGNTELKYLTLGDGINEISGEAFSGCTALSSVDVPNSVEKIGASAFADCAALSTIHIGSGIKSIHSNSFTGCIKLREIIFWGTKEQWKSAARSGIGMSVTVHCLDGDLV